MFSVVILENIQAEKREVQALVVAPTREIVLQINDVIRSIAHVNEMIKVSPFVGGFKVKEDKASLIKSMLYFYVFNIAFFHFNLSSNRR